ncbi:uncharacterized protein EDB91DRAFT_1085251 [Suillus paluster]|uniref:uncharacterized protein n=1 Tax=Suillus paluster TaxID=48578 RepID=UPI001B876336|nr:uncharacterized protein EDB91DRAFT_1085251 [Suillus paluster]KAG1730956.1 hypothetical protein EDB91DRAFT_1085251 [Suillus paluster]
MNLLPCTVLLYIALVCASLPILNATSIHTNSSDSPSYSNTRTLWDIIWSCGATLLACTWTAIHPNIPGMNEGKLTIMRRRLFIMVVALISPELIITWAAWQFLSARAAAKKFNSDFGSQCAQAHRSHWDISESTATFLDDIPDSNERYSQSPSALGFKPSKFRGRLRWTVVHGFFACMGGFILYVNDEPQGTLTPNELRHFISEGYVDMPVITEEEIEDRSKGDGLSKGIVILQLAWFILQLVARYTQNLQITAA